MHDEIIRYSMNGDITDANLEAHKRQLVEFVEAQMREDGVIPSLDLDPGFTIDYNARDDKFNFELSVYGIWVGSKEELWQIAGMTSGKKIMKYTPQVKSKAS